MSFLINGLLFGPIVLISLALFLFGVGFRNRLKVSRRLISVGLLMLVLVCGWLGLVVASSGWLGGAIAFFVGILATGVAIVGAIYILVILEGSHTLGWRRRAFLGITNAAFPVMMFLSILIGDAFSPKSTTEVDGVVVAQALKQYHVDNGAYPQRLNDLVPKYLANLKEPETEWGWLYTSKDDEFSLGYVYDVDGYGYSVCLYSSNVPQWNCLPYSTGPFTLGPTPMH